MNDGEACIGTGMQNGGCGIHRIISEVDANLEMQCRGPTLLTCDRLEEVHQHVLGNVLTEHKSLHY